MKTSVVILCIDYYQYLQDAIHSCARQTSVCEIIVVTTGRQEVMDICKASGIVKCIVSKNDSLSAMWNLGIKSAKGQYIIPLGADDMLHPIYAELVEMILDNNPQFDLICPDIWKFGIEEGLWKTDGLSERTKNSNTLFFSSAYRKDLWKKIGGYDENLGYFLDWDFWLTAHKLNAQSYIVPAPLFLYRIHEKNLSRHYPQDKLNAEMDYMKGKGLFDA